MRAVRVWSAVQGTSSPQEAADRLLSSVYMAIVSDVAEAEGLSEEQVRPGRPLPCAPDQDYLVSPCTALPQMRCRTTALCTGSRR